MGLTDLFEVVNLFRRSKPITSHDSIVREFVVGSIFQY